MAQSGLMTHRNFADPSFEPSDEDLQTLSHQAFAGLKDADAERLLRLRQQIAQQREYVLQQLRIVAPR